MDRAQKGQDSTEKVGQEEVEGDGHGDSWKDFGETAHTVSCDLLTL